MSLLVIGYKVMYIAGKRLEINRLDNNFQGELVEEHQKNTKKNTCMSGFYSVGRNYEA